MEILIIKVAIVTKTKVQEIRNKINRQIRIKVVKKGKAVAGPFRKEGTVNFRQTSILLHFIVKAFDA